MQNLPKGVNVVSKGSPSRIFSVLLISLRITILPKSSTLLTIPVAFIYLSPFPVGNDLCVVLFFVLQFGTAHRPFPTIILQITLFVSVNGRRLYRRIYFLFTLCYHKNRILKGRKWICFLVIRWLCIGPVLII